jgi:integrase
MAKTKNGKPHWVYLTPTAKVQTSKPFNVSPTAVQAWVKRRSPGWTPHDLRRTFATLAMDNGVLPHVVEKCLNHSLEGMLRVYAHSEMTEERIAAAKTVERVVLEITGATGSTGRKSEAPGDRTTKRL